MEEALLKIARKRGYGKKRTSAYVYGTLRKTGWRPKKHRITDADKRKAARLIARKMK